MQSNSSHSQHRHEMITGVDVLKAFRSMGNEATVDQLGKIISKNVGIPKESVDPKIKHLLSNGIRSRLLVTDGLTYSVNRYDNKYDVDAPKRRKMSVNRAPTETSAFKAEASRKVQHASRQFRNQYQASSQRKLSTTMPVLLGLNEDLDESTSGDSEEDDEQTQFSDTSSEEDEEPRRKSLLMSKYNLK